MFCNTDIQTEYQLERGLNMAPKAQGVYFADPTYRFLCFHNVSFIYRDQHRKL